ncbi:hypothetical protein WN943_018987 [Citrus x changshan-huyou]
MHSFIRKQDAINNQNAQTFSDLKDTLVKIAYALIIQEKRKFPVQPQPNPKIQNAPIDQVKLVITLQSGKVIDRPIPEPCENENSKGKEELDKLTPSEKITNVPSEPLFPHALNKPRKSNHSSVIYEIFKQVNVNIPLLDAIKQVSTILSTNNKLKYKDPGCPIISCIIGDHKIEHALLDLGASVNLLPHSLYLQLNLETETVVNNYKPIPIILGRPFLATANALINCRNGLMNLSFGNMTLELNVFNMCRQANEENENEDEIVEQKELLCKSDDGKPKFEELGIIEKTEQQEAPKLELKPLPEGLKYAYLGKAQTYPVVISSTLSSDQGGKMPSQWNTQEKKKFLVEVKKFYWDDPYLFKYCPDQIFRRSIPDNEFPTITEISKSSMEEIQHKLHKHFPSLPQNALKNIYKARCERLRLLMIKEIPFDICWLIEAKVRLASEFPDLFISYIPGFGKSTFAKKQRARRLGSECHNCVRLSCKLEVRKPLGMVSDNREDKIKFVKDGMSKESLDDILRSLETHRSGHVQYEIHRFHYGKYKEFVQAAVDLSHAIAERNLHLVYGGGDRGLSKLVSEAVFIRGNQVLDIIPQALKPLGCMSDVPIGEELVVLSMQERITEMLNHADAFIFLLGDLATLEALITLTS